MKKEFVVERHGRSFVLYAGLLNMAHESGLTGINTQLIQAPNEQNGHTAICSATVNVAVDGTEKCFTGIGDASPSNVPPAMQTSVIRMAETRAKARALRDAVNVGMASIEEEGIELNATANGAARRSNGNDTMRRRPQNGYRQPQDSLNKEPRTAPVETQDGISADQMRAIHSLASRRGYAADEIASSRFQGKQVAELSNIEAAGLIRWLSSRNTAKAPAGELPAAG
jgi:hypothetical protein